MGVGHPSAAPTLAILAGGSSLRMGQAKALLPVPPDNTPLTLHMIRRLQGVVASPALIIANEGALIAEISAAAQNLPDVELAIYPDRWPGYAALGGIGTASSHVTDRALLLACDMPLINPALCIYLSMLAREADNSGETLWDAVVPVVHGYVEPLHALYHAGCLPAIERMIAAVNGAANSFLRDVRVRYVNEAALREVDAALHSFSNVNTPEQWQAALSALAEE